MRRRQAVADALDILEPEAVAVVIGALRPILRNITRLATGELVPALRPATGPGPLVGLGAAAVDDLAAILRDWGIAVDTEVLPYYEQVYRAGGLAAVRRAAELGIEPAAVPLPTGPPTAAGTEAAVNLFANTAIDAATSDLFDEAGVRWLAEARSQFMTVGEQAWADARRTMIEGMTAGRGIKDIARQLREVTDETQRMAELIARTNVVGAANAGADKRMELLGDKRPKYKQWLATMDSRTRPAHANADGDVVEFDAMFTVGGVAMRYPHDPAGGPANTWNCRCTVLYTDKPEGEVEGVEGRGEGGVLEDVAAPEPSGIFGLPSRDQVPDDLHEVYDDILAFRRLPVPRRSHPRGFSQPSDEFLDYELRRRQIGLDLDYAIRQRIGLPPARPALRGSLRDRPALEQWQSKMTPWIRRYQAQMNTALDQLGVRFGGKLDWAPVAGGPRDMAGRLFVPRNAAYDQVNMAAQNFPSSWIDRMNTRPLGSAWHVDKNIGASWYQHHERQINLRLDWGETAATHELGHHAESVLDELRAAQWAEKFRRESIEMQGEGGLVRRWGTLDHRGQIMGADYWTNPDNYPDAYMGRVYGALTEPLPDTHYELWTRGSEAFLVDPSDPGFNAYHIHMYDDLALRGWLLGVLATIR